LVQIQKQLGEEAQFSRQETIYSPLDELFVITDKSGPDPRDKFESIPVSEVNITFRANK
jgi:hypothetical protein